MIHWLIGPSGAGKSTVGSELATRRSAWFIDLDQKIEKETGRSVPEIFAEYGEDGFRIFEREALLQIVKEHKRKRLVVAVGGGGVVDPRNRDLMRSTGLRVFLQVDANTALERITGSTESNIRPLLAGDDPESTWKLLADQRGEAYADHDITVDALGTPTEVVDRIVQGIYKFHTSRWHIKANLAGETSHVRALRSPYSTIRAVRRMTRFARRCILTDNNLLPIYEGTIHRLAGNDGILISVEPGEESKSFRQVEEIIEKLLDAGFTRSDCIIGFGGGVVTDLAGFVASIYMRGLRCISIPTSLLGMVDASVGGKTAINAAGTRNLVGTFRQPSDVLICDSFLRTLPQRERNSGMVEALKMGIVVGGHLYDLAVREGPEIVAGNIPPRMSEIVRESIIAKLEIVSKDVHDQKERHQLNLGHTFGHALEGLYPGIYTHGEAVAFGIVSAVELAIETIPFTDKDVVNAYAEQALPYTFLPERAPDFAELVQKMNGDKKRTSGILRFVMVTGKQVHSGTKLSSTTRATWVISRPIEEPKIIAAMERAWERIVNYHRGKQGNQ